MKTPFIAMVLITLVACEARAAAQLVFMPASTELVAPKIGLG